ncbi:leucine-rich repeat domain-containing protein [Chryseobacterium jejuense]|nr:leucine-rich repeat domain-containing protein [Chryseobacterium jejuense]
MSVPHPGFFLPISNRLEYISFINCEVNNISELNLLPDLYSLTIDNTSIIDSKNGIQYQGKPDKRSTIIQFQNLKVNDLDSFLPISTSLHSISLLNCEVESLKNIHKFSSVKRLYLHPPLQVNDLSLPDPDHDGKQFEFEFIMIVPERMVDYNVNKDWVIPDFNTELLASIAPYVPALIVDGYHLTNTHILKDFPILYSLDFNKCSIDLEDYVLVAPKIQEVDFNRAKVRNQKAFSYFTKLEKITVSGDYNRPPYIALKKLLPLKGHLKEINIYETSAVRNIGELKHFTVLEQLHTSAKSIELAQDILSIESLKDLYLNIYQQNRKIERPITLDLQHLKNVEKLHLDSNDDVYFTGISHLKSLKTLELDDNGDLEGLTALTSLEKLVIKGEVINKFPELKQVKILDLHVPRNYEVASLEKFPNLEKLELNLWSDQKIAINGLKKLKIIVFDYINFDDIISFENLPSLEEVDLTECRVSSLSKLKRLTSLKKLNLENNDIKSLEGIENLKNLEQLAFDLGNITDFTPLNKLPKLREVFIWGNNKRKEDIEGQLSKPEILIRNAETFQISID